MSRTLPRLRPSLLPPVLFLSALVAGCAGGPDTKPERDARVEEEFRQRQALKQEGVQSDTFDRALILMDQTMDEYVRALVGAGNERMEQRAESLRRYLYSVATRHFDALILAASDPEYGRNRGVALAALGFSQRRDVLDVLVSATEDRSEQVRTNALFALGELADPRTPHKKIALLMEDDQQPISTRIAASRTLLRLQGNSFEASEIIGAWVRVLSGSMQELDPAIVVHAIRGTGLSRDATLLEVVAPYAAHPDALVRAATALAVGRLNNTAGYTTLLSLIGPAETNANVRLCARKALQALAGGADRGYDVELWKRLFERG